MKDIILVTLAAGNGTRMKSVIPKPLHKIAGQTILEHSFECVKNLLVKKKIIIASDDLITQGGNILNESQIVIQTEKLGTGHAVMQCIDDLYDNCNVVINYGDTPFVKPETIAQMLEKLNNGWDIIVLGSHIADISQKYGRLITNGEDLVEIIEYKDANEEVRASNFCNSGIIVANGKILKQSLAEIKPNNASGEYYLTDIIKIAKDSSHKATFVKCEENEVMGINSRIDLAIAEGHFQQILRKKHLENGVTMLDPASVYFSFDTIIENDVILENNIHFGLGVCVKNGTIIKAFSHLEKCKVGNNCVIGPFARIRPNTILQNSVHIGNFVEIKASELSEGVKANHLTYIGDAKIGEKTNIGAGTITCNYDGFEKHKTQIGSNVFVGSNTCFIAPINVEDSAITAAGSVISKNVPKNAIAIERSEQKNIENAAERFRKKKK